MPCFWCAFSTLSHRSGNSILYSLSYGETCSAMYECRVVGHCRIDEESLSATVGALSSHAVQVSPSPATTANTPSPDSRPPSPARTVQLQTPHGEREQPAGGVFPPLIGAGLSGAITAPEAEPAAAQAEWVIKKDAATTAPRKCSPSPACPAQLQTPPGEGEQPAGFISPPVDDAWDTNPIAAAPELVTERAAAQAAQATEGAAGLASPALDAAPEDHIAQENPGLTAGSQVPASVAPAQLSAAGSAEAQAGSALVKSSGKGDAQKGSTGTGNCADATEQCRSPPAFWKSMAALHGAPQVSADARLSPTAEQASQPKAAERTPKMPSAAAAAGAVSSPGARFGFSEAEEVRSPERMGMSRPPAVIKSPFAAAVMQGYSGADPKTAKALEAAVLQPAQVPAAGPGSRLSTEVKASAPASATSALDALVRGDMPSPILPAQEGFEPLVKAPREPSARAHSPAGGHSHRRCLTGATGLACSDLPPFSHQSLKK